ncbi:MAG TPA: isocitrate lyase/PEP mutase family protein [Candidatus Bathyarchaeia archaeon]
MDSRGKRFRELLKRPGLLLRPCAYDALSAVLIERAGFDAVGTSGYGISASLIGQPDMGLVGYQEMLERTRTIVNAVGIPVDVDIDTGYGNALNVYWTVANFARVGAAGVRVEDQTWPKRCGHMAGKQVVPVEEMLQKLAAALKARNEESPDMVVGARTDARSVNGFEDALARARSYAEAGADYVYVEAPQSPKEVRTLVHEVPAPLAFNVIPGGKTPPFDIGEMERLGVKYLSVPMVCLYSATKAMAESLRVLRETRDVKRLAGMGVSWAEFNELVGMSRWRRLELEVLPEEQLLKMYGSTDLDEIIRGELEGTQRMWDKK